MRKNYLKGLSCVPFSTIECFDDVNDSFWTFEKLLSEVVNERNRECVKKGVKQEH